MLLRSMAQARYRYNAGCVYNLHLHFVWCPKYRKAVKHIPKLHQHIANQRKDFHHKTTLSLVRKHGVIAVEDLNIKGIARTRLAKSTHDVARGQFLTILQYIAGRLVVQWSLLTPGIRPRRAASVEHFLTYPRLCQTVRITVLIAAL